MSQPDPRFQSLLENGVAPSLVESLATHLTTGDDAELARINPLEFAARFGFNEDATIDAFVRAARVGLLDLSWNVMCPGCGALLGENTTLASVTRSHYPCALCVARYEPTLDELVEVDFMPNRRVRHIAAHDPERLPTWQYLRQIAFSPSLVMPRGAEWDALLSRYTLYAGELAEGARAELQLTLPREFLIVFEPVWHTAAFIDVQGEPTSEPQELTLVFTAEGASPGKVQLRPGPLKLTLENHTTQRALPSVWIADDAFHHLLTKRPYLTAKRLISNQTFRDLFRAETLGVDQRLRIASLTMVFTDLKGSTEMYERVGDLAAYDLVRDHFKVLARAVRANGGAVVKTIGDAVMATFAEPERGMRAALEMRDGIDALNREGGREDLIVKIGMHEGPCLAVTSNDRLDYFGQTVNIAARVQGLAEGRAIQATEPVVKNERVAQLLAARGTCATTRRAMLKGIRDEVLIYEIP